MTGSNPIIEKLHTCGVVGRDIRRISVRDKTNQYKKVVVFEFEDGSSDDLPIEEAHEQFMALWRQAGFYRRMMTRIEGLDGDAG